MRGHEPLIAMRRKGLVPSCAFINVDDDDCPLQMWRGWDREQPAIAQLMVERADAIERMDLRCLVGMKVHIHGEDEERVRKVFEACIAAKASQVYAAVCWGEWVGGEYRCTGCKSLDSNRSHEWQQ